MRRTLPLFLLGASAVCWAYPPGPQVLSFLSSDDTEQPFAVYIPKTYAAQPGSSKRFPLVVSLHGAWSNHRLNMKRIFGVGNMPGEPDHLATRYWRPMADVEMFVASPYARGTMGYRGIAERDVLTVVAEMKRLFPIDEDRVYLTGLSMGGGGTLEIGLKYPSMWAAIAPLCPVPMWSGDKMAVNARNLPVFLHQGDKDPLIPVAGTRALVEKMREADVAVEYKEYPGVAHNVWDPAYANAAVFEWFAKHKRNAFPKRVRYAASGFSDVGRVYWLEFRGVKGEVDVDAEFVGRNEVVIQGTLSAWRIEAKGHPMYDPSKPLTVTVNGVKEGAAAELPWAGPVFVGEALGRPHVWVYGTKDKPGREERARRRAEIERAADWVGGAGRVLYQPRIAADAEVGEGELANTNLILFGTAETNALIAKFADKAPMALKGPALAAHGLLYQMAGPGQGQTIVVNSGIPFTAGMERFKSTSLGFIPPQQRVLMHVKEFLLYEGGVDRAVEPTAEIVEKR